VLSFKADFVNLFNRHTSPRRWLPQLQLVWPTGAQFGDLQEASMDKKWYN